MKEMYSEGDKHRTKSISTDPNFPVEDYRTPWRRDYARLLHSPSFRRLQGKAQLFPGMETDFFRNRLTHSLEVAQIAKSIAIKLNHDLCQEGYSYQIEPDIVEFAALAHDLGHPPFGHFGEEALDELMVNSGGFEGNAQTLRILTKLEKRELIRGTELGIDQNGKDVRVGLDLTCRSLASILKYDNKIPFQRERHGVVKGYYYTEADIVKNIKKQLAPNRGNKQFKVIECQIMDIADDIAYSTYDLEDSFKAGFLKPLDLICAPDELLEIISKKLKDPRRIGVNISATEIKERIRNIFADFKIDYELKNSDIKVTPELLEWLHFNTLDYAEDLSNHIAKDGYFRTRFTSRLVGSAIREVKIKKVDAKIPSLSTVELKKDKLIDVEILKNYVFQSQILSPKIQIFKRRSREIIFEIFKAINDTDGEMLLPEDFKIIYKALRSKNDKKRVICDFIAGMTDNYAIEFYGRLKAINPQTIFKPMS